MGRSNLANHTNPTGPRQTSWRDAAPVVGFRVACGGSTRFLPSLSGLAAWDAYYPPLPAVVVGYSLPPLPGLGSVWCAYASGCVNATGPMVLLAKNLSCADAKQYPNAHNHRSSDIRNSAIVDFRFGLKT